MKLKTAMDIVFLVSGLLTVYIKSNEIVKGIDRAYQTDKKMRILDSMMGA
jgi:hypothetical protein